jgi:hypothetical protein
MRGFRLGEALLARLRVLRLGAHLALQAGAALFGLFSFAGLDGFLVRVPQLLARRLLVTLRADDAAGGEQRGTDQ